MMIHYAEKHDHRRLGLIVLLDLKIAATLLQKRSLLSMPYSSVLLSLLLEPFRLF